LIFENSILPFQQSRRGRRRRLRYDDGRIENRADRHLQHVYGAFDVETEEVEPMGGLRSALDRTIKKVVDGEALLVDTIVSDELAAGLLASWWRKSAR